MKKIRSKIVNSERIYITELFETAESGHSRIGKEWTLPNCLRVVITGLFQIESGQ